MTKPNLAKVAKNIRLGLSKHSPEILTGIGIAGMITTTVLAVKATPKALALLEEAQEEKGEYLTAPEKVKSCWKCYIPTVATGAFSAACLIGANSVHASRNAALATAYKISETALSEYRDKVIETIGEKKEQVVRDKVAEERIKNDPVSKKEVVMTGSGKSLCYDYMSGRYFESDINEIKKAANKLNQKMLLCAFGYASLNDFYDELGLECVGIGDMVGWNVANLIDISISSQIADDGRPCIVLGHSNEPRYEYDSSI